MVFLTELVAINRKWFDTSVFCKFEICLRRLVKKAQGKKYIKRLIWNLKHIVEKLQQIHKRQNRSIFLLFLGFCSDDSELL
ncbi:hypothetical protein T10_8653 [Trichinella papuae]|uniref:Uncharacterized protein n=1 Tax=Trichinella papuae TaxID=268474 RepID=A0A0V1MFG3_9BILA|nr:hypothetical protein T10_8653 [Trichinella papuae]